MKTSSFACLLIMAATAASPAFAQRENGSNPSFTGVRFESRAGHDSFSGNITMPDPDHPGATITASSRNGRIGYGAEIGYDRQLGPVVVGAYAGVDNSSTSDCVAIVGDDIGCLESGRNIYAGGRAGVVIGGNLLIYGRGGFSRARYSLTYLPDDHVPTNYVIADSAAGTHYGGGVEMAFTRNFYGRLEYVRTLYQRLDTVSPLDDDDAVSIRARRSQVSAGIGLRF